MKQDIIDNIVKDEDFLKKIIELKSIEEARAAFKEKGLDLSKEDVETIGELVRFQIEKAEKIKESTLEKITGGWSDPEFKKFKNFSLGLSALVIGLSVAYATISIGGKLSGHMTDVRGSWVWRLATYNEETKLSGRAKQ